MSKNISRALLYLNIMHLSLRSVMQFLIILYDMMTSCFFIIIIILIVPSFVSWLFQSHTFLWTHKASFSDALFLALCKLNSLGAKNTSRFHRVETSEARRVFTSDSFFSVWFDDINTFRSVEMENRLKLQRETDYSRLQMNRTDLNDNNDAYQSQLKSYSSSQAVWEANEGSSVSKSVKSPFFDFEWRSNIWILLSKQSNSLRAVNNDTASSQTASQKNHFPVKNKGPQTGMASVRTQPALQRKRLSNQHETKLNHPDVDKQLRRLRDSLVQSFSSVSDAIFGGEIHQVLKPTVAPPLKLKSRFISTQMSNSQLSNVFTLSCD